VVIAKRQADLRAEAGGRPAAAAAAASVSMAGLAFQPRTLTVRKGATVVFDNDDTAPHTVTADQGPIDSGVLDPPASGSAWPCRPASPTTAPSIRA
jgi:plastocyanin